MEDENSGHLSGCKGGGVRGASICEWNIVLTMRLQRTDRQDSIELNHCVAVCINGPSRHNCFTGTVIALFHAYISLNHNIIYY